MSDYVSGKLVKKQYGVSTSTLHNWSSENKDEEKKIHVIRTPGGSRLYRASDVQKLFGKKDQPEESRINIAYARVSSSHQKADLGRQISAIRSEYPDIQVIEDIGSGIDFKRPGLVELLEQIYQNNIQTVVVL